jgi:hypothetical protein|nr:MAG TPA: hypothetical protein [Caudoviricetes sp.]
MILDIETALHDLETRSAFKNNDLISLLEVLDLQVRDIPLKDFQESRLVKTKSNPLHSILNRLPKKWFYDKDTLKENILKLLENEDNEDRLKEIQDILNR